MNSRDTCDMEGCALANNTWGNARKENVSYRSPLAPTSSVISTGPGMLQQGTSSKSIKTKLILQIVLTRVILKNKSSETDENFLLLTSSLVRTLIQDGVV
jgi:hypothetical protein